MGRYPADRWRVAASMDAWGCDDMERFFRRPPSEVSDSDVARWRACVEAVREEMRGG
jgi:hypothetical protein